MSLPADLRADLARVSEATGIPISRIVEQGARARLAEIERGDLVARKAETDEIVRRVIEELGAGRAA